jgi:hypothetical protein
MNNTQIIMQLVPSDYWDNEADAATAIKPFVEDALAIERRLPKQVNLASERMRYQICCKRIQNAASRMELKTKKEALSPDYFEVQRIIAESYPVAFSDSRISACFFPPNMLDIAIIKLENLAETSGFSENPDVNKRIKFFKTAIEKDAGVIETIDFLVDAADGNMITDAPIADRKDTHPSIKAVSTDHEMLSNEDLKSIEEILRNKIVFGLETGEPVNFSNQPHPVITEALHSFVYHEEGKSSGEIQVIYMDGTEAEPFPAYGLASPESTVDWDEIPPVKASLISMRHLEMDDKVDFAWFRNRKVSTPAPFAETDAYCTTTTIEMLHGLGDGEYLHLHLYQTGLETAVVGLYRGLVKALSEFRKSSNAPIVRVVPYYYKNDAYQAGTPWE